MADSTSKTLDHACVLKPSVCIVCHNAYGAICGGHSGHIGGVEWQTSILAKWLAEKGYVVSLLTWDDGGAPVETVAGVRVIKICGRRAGLRGLRFFHPRWTSLNRAMRLADADVYYHHGAEGVTGQIALWCRRNGKKFVFSAACDTDYEAGLRLVGNLRDRALYRYGLHRADALVAQTEFQQSLLKRGFALDSTVLRYPCPDLSIASNRLPEPKSNRVLWIARVCRQKRPDLLLDLAEMCPEMNFDIVGPIYSDEYAEEVRKRAMGMANVTLHGPVPRDKVPCYYKTALCLCCTSDYEGFPNTFLEAWSHGLPVISRFDPDSLIESRKLGMVAKALPQMRDAMRSLLSSRALFQELSINARKYFEANHTFEAVLPKYEQLLQEVWSPPMTNHERCACGPAAGSRDFVASA